MCPAAPCHSGWPTSTCRLKSARRDLTETQRAILDGVSRVHAIRGFYLAGGTALALRHGHRLSIDFDFFLPAAFEEEALSLALADAFPDFERLPSGAETLYVRLSGVTTSFFRYSYPLLEPTEATPWSIGLASVADIAAMKIEAIAGRGSRKDFVDSVFWLVRDCPSRRRSRPSTGSTARAGANVITA